LPKQKLCLLDADAPYALEAKLPGAQEEVISLDGCRNTALLREQKEAITQLQERCQREQLRTVRFLRAARAMKRDMVFVAGMAADVSKIDRYASRFAARHFPAPTGLVGRESRSFLTAVTGQGLLLRRSGITSLCRETIILEDEYGVAAPQLWNLVRAYALGNGQDVISCPCLLSPNGGPEHLLLPGLGLACITANRRHPIDIDGAQHIQATRFFDKDILRAHRCRLSFGRRTLRELLAEVYQAQEAAEAAKYALAEAYAAAIDFDEVESYAMALDW
jgi:hypothetical protein